MRIKEQETCLNLQEKDDDDDDDDDEYPHFYFTASRNFNIFKKNVLVVIGLSLVLCNILIEILENYVRGQR